MKFWSSGETYGDEIDYMFHKTRLKQDIELNEYLKDKTYGEELDKWNIIYIIIPKFMLDQGFFKEIKKFRKKDADVEFRLQIDYEKYKKANEKQAMKLLYETLLKSIEIAKEEFDIFDFNLDDFKADIQKAGQLNGWLK